MEVDEARAIAAQVAVGLMPGDEAGARARAALMGIGLMVRNAVPEDDSVRAILEGAEEYEEPSPEPVG